MNNSRKLCFGITILLSQTIMAHEEPPVQINNNHCSGVSYQLGIWNESSQIGQGSSNRSNQPLATCNDVVSGDNCGQFDLAFNFSENFCAIHTDSRRQAIYSSISQTYYYGPENFIQEDKRINYSLSEGVNFSCNICASNEHIQFENSNNKPQDSFFAGESIFLHWWRSYPHLNSLPYNGYRIESQKRLINSKSAFQSVAQTGIELGAFGRINLTEKLVFEACHEYNLIVSVRDLDGLWADSNHIVKVFDNLLCPQVAESMPLEPSENNSLEPME